MITNKWKKLIKSLHSKKHRKNNAQFLVEGEKVFLELLNSDYKICYAIVSESVFNEINEEVDFELIVVEENEIKQLSTLKNNFSALAVVEMKSIFEVTSFEEKSYLTLVLDGIQDPGNLGTIIRTADWYGIKNVICSEDCVDFYNPKVITSTKGSFCRVLPIYTDLVSFLETQKEATIYGAFMDGTSIYEVKPSENTMLIMGNESNGVRTEIEPFISKKVTIPQKGRAESLNVAIATSILCDNFIRMKP